MTDTPAIEYKSLASLKCWARNYRSGDIGAITQSLLRFGFNGALRVWREGVVIAGNHTLLALQGIKASGLQAPRNVREINGAWHVAVIDCAWMTATESQAFAIADNRLSALAENDDQRLAELLTEIASEDAKLLSAIGYDGDDLDELLRGLADTSFKGADSEPQIDKADELQKQWETSQGQLWQLGRHRLLIDDCTIEANVKRLMNGKKADAVIADAPYGMRLDTHYKRGDTGKYNGVTDANRKNYTPVIGDDTDFDPRPVMELLDAPEQFWFGADYYADCIPNRNDGSWLVWDKRAGIEDIEFTLSEFELIWSKQRHARNILRVKWFGIQGMEKQDTKERVHPTQKPLELIGLMLKDYTTTGKLIVDPYCGSGTTLIACEQLNRICYGCEIDPRYAAVIIDRWQSVTGISPQLIT